MTGEAATTGTCAAAAAKAAALHAGGLPVPRRLDVPLPGGGRTEVELRAWGGARSRPWASVRKPSSEDPDATRGAVVVVSLSPAEGLSFRAGPGVGVVTRPGLQLAVGEPAINPGPRGQIAQALAESGSVSWQVTISVQGGLAIAARTFNPRLGIVGGISILGTAGMVRPWSRESFLRSVEAQLSVVLASGQRTLVLVPGHMGEKAASRRLPGLECVEVGNAWGDVLDRASRRGFAEVIALGHPGKLVKIAQGQWDTHSSQGSSAARWSLRFLRKALGPEVLGSDPARVPDTLEELLLGLDPHAEERAASLLASRVARRLGARVGLPARVVLVDLGGSILGEGAS
jgi:cobalt-precorrin-5B (C1)-methyltransferase